MFVDPKQRCKGIMSSLFVQKSSKIKDIKCIVFAATTRESLIFAQLNFKIHEIVNNVPVVIKMIEK